MTGNPHLTYEHSPVLGRTVWFCAYRGSFVVGTADTPLGAYNDWLSLISLVCYQQPTTMRLK